MAKQVAKQATEEASKNGASSFRRDQVKTRQVQAFYGLLIECGFDRMLDEALKSRSKGGFVTAEQQQGDAELTEDQVLKLIAEIDLGGMFRTLAKSDGITRLSMCMYDMDTEEAGEVPIEKVLEDFPTFAVLSYEPMQTLLGFGQFMA